MRTRARGGVDARSALRGKKAAHLSALGSFDGKCRRIDAPTHRFIHGSRSKASYVAWNAFFPRDYVGRTPAPERGPVGTKEITAGIVLVL